MLNDLLGAIWRRAPKSLRRLSMRATHTRFTVTAAGVILNDQGQILLLKHHFRVGSGWGLPGGFIDSGEQPHEALRRELCEEIGLELEKIEILESRTFKKPTQIEIVFLCHARGPVKPQSREIQRAAWFVPTSLPDGLPADQRGLIQRALLRGANQVD